MRETTNVTEFSKLEGDSIKVDKIISTTFRSTTAQVMTAPTEDYDVLRKADFDTFSASFAGTNESSKRIYAPLTSGNPGQYLMSEGGRNPVWRDSFFYSGAQINYPSDTSGTTVSIDIKLDCSIDLNLQKAFLASVKFYERISVSPSKPILFKVFTSASPNNLVVTGTYVYNPDRTVITANEIITFYVRSDATSTTWTEFTGRDFSSFTINGKTTGVSIYAPESAGTRGQILISDGPDGAPFWFDFTMNGKPLYSVASGNPPVADMNNSFYAPVTKGAANQFLTGAGTGDYPTWKSITASDLASGGSDGQYLVKDGNGFAWKKIDIPDGFSASAQDGPPSKAGYLLWSETGATPIYYKNPKLDGQMTALSFNVSSDKRLKNILSEFCSEPNRRLSSLPVYNYTFKDSTEHHIGIMAQDLQEQFPELVVEDEDGYLSIKESKLVYLLLAEVKELQKTIDKLKELLLKNE